MAETNLSKNKEGYGYKYTDLAQIHEYLEKNNMKYRQKIERIDNEDYVFTKCYIDGKWEDEWVQGCKIVDAVLNGIKNPAQEQGSALTYARRYSLLMAFGLATEDDDGASLTQKSKNKGNDKLNKVTEAEAKTIYALMLRKGVDVTVNLQKLFKISNTNELTKEQFAQLVKKLNGMPDKEKSKD